LGKIGIEYIDCSHTQWDDSICEPFLNLYNAFEKPGKGVNFVCGTSPAGFVKDCYFSYIDVKNKINNNVYDKYNLKHFSINIVKNEKEEDVCGALYPVYHNRECSSEDNNQKNCKEYYSMTLMQYSENSFSKLINFSEKFCNDSFKKLSAKKNKIQQELSEDDKKNCEKYINKDLISPRLFSFPLQDSISSGIKLEQDITKIIAFYIANGNICYDEILPLEEKNNFFSNSNLPAFFSFLKISPNHEKSKKKHNSLNVYV